jgi:hypothetical protein
MGIQRSFLGFNGGGNTRGAAGIARFVPTSNETLPPPPPPITRNAKIQ